MPRKTQYVASTTVRVRLASPLLKMTRPPLQIRTQTQTPRQRTMTTIGRDHLRTATTVGPFLLISIPTTTTTITAAPPRLKPLIQITATAVAALAATNKPAVPATMAAVTGRQRNLPRSTHTAHLARMPTSVYPNPNPEEVGV